MEELAGKLEEKRKDVVHLEACLKKEIDRHDEAAQLGGDAQRRADEAGAAGLQVQQAEDATRCSGEEEMAEAMRAHEREVGALMARHARSRSRRSETTAR